MKELFESDFGKLLDKATKKTTKMAQGQAVYSATSKVGDTIKKGDQIYSDTLHKDHIEVFTSTGKFKAVLNLEGTVNAA